MPADVPAGEHAPRKLRLADACRASSSARCRPTTPPLEHYLGPEIVTRIRRVMRAPVKLLGGYSQMLPSNWKLYMENVKDSYHASLLHTFFTTFRLNRLSQKGGIVVSETGGNHVSYSLAADTGGKEYEQAGMRAAQEGFGLEAPQLLESVDEFGDGIGLQILSVFPDLRAAADPQQPRGAAPGAAGPRKDRAGLDALRLYRRRRGDDRAAAAAGQPDRAGRLHFDGGRRRAGLRAARRRDRGRSRYRSWRWAARDRVRGQPRHRGGGARLLEGLSRADGNVLPHASRDAMATRACRDSRRMLGADYRRMDIELSSRSRISMPATPRRSTTTGSRRGRISSPRTAAIASPRRRMSSTACRSA